MTLLLALSLLAADAAEVRLTGERWSSLREPDVETPPPPPGLPVALQVPVTLGTLQRGAYAVRGGLNAGDQVILGNLFQLRSGMPVKPTAGPAQRS